MKKIKQPNRSATLKKNSTLTPPVYYVLLLVIILTTVFVYSKSLNNGFIVNWDDDGYILNNTLVQDLNTQNIKTIFSSFHMGNYHPLTTLSYALEFNFFKTNPKPYHTLNLLLHLFNVVLVFVFIKKLCKKDLTALLTASIFALHPMHVESVAWVSERKDVLYTFFFLMSAILYVQFTIKNKIWLYIVSITAFLLALLSKSAAVVLPLILFLIDYYQYQKISLKSILQKTPYLLLALIFGIIALKSQGAQQQLLTPDYTIINSFFVASYAFGFYLLKFFIPFKLSAFYPHPAMEGQALPFIYYLSPLLIFIFIFLVYKIVNDRKSVIFGLLFLFITLALVLQFFPVGGAVVADRYTYVPYIGLAFVTAIYIDTLFFNYKKFQTLIIISLLACLISCSAISYKRTEVWANGLTLFDDVIQKQPDAFYAYHSRGIVYYYRGFEKLQKGNNTASIEFKKSLSDYDRAIMLNGNYGLTYYNRGLSHMQLKNYELAIRDFTRVAELIPNSDQAYNDRAIAYYYTGNTDKALLDYNEAIKLNPDNLKAYYNRANILLRLNNLENACTDFKEAAQKGLKEADEAFKKYCK